MTTRPNVFEFIDYRKFLTEWRESKKDNNPGLTHEYLCAKLGQNNRTYFSDLEKGRKKIGSEALDRLIRLIGFKGDEAKYFRAIVQYGLSVTYDEKEFWFEQAIQLNNTPKKIVDKTTYDYYRKWYHSTVRAYLDTCNFKDDYQEASRVLYNRVTPDEIREAIANLRALGLVSPDADGYLRPVDKVIITGEEVKDELLQCYQLANIDLIRSIVAENKPDTYDCRHLTVSVSEEGISRIKKRIKQLRSEIIAIVHKDADKADRIYKIALHLIPESIKD